MFGAKQMLIAKLQRLGTEEQQEKWKDRTLVKKECCYHCYNIWYPLFKKGFCSQSVFSLYFST